MVGSLQLLGVDEISMCTLSDAGKVMKISSQVGRKGLEER
jgi:hypothetical protein